MSKEKPDSLFEKYLAAETTLTEEEKFLRPTNQANGIQEWSMYVNQKRKKAPANFNDIVWKSIQARNRRKQWFLSGLSGVAASVALLVAIVVGNTNNENVSYNEKAALLNEALSMFPEGENKSLKQNIIYEDDMVVIYTASK